MRNARLLVLLGVALLGLAACGGDAGTAATTEATAEAPAGGDARPEDSIKGDDDSSPAATTIVIADGGPVDGVAELEYGAGEKVSFVVESDLAEEIHVHGYDISKDVPAGGSASFEFPAEIEGIFEVEMEGQGVQVAELRVNP